MSSLLPIPPREQRPVDDPSACQFCGHDWHGVECSDDWGPTFHNPMWPSYPGHVCRCPSSYVEQAGEPC